MTAAAARRVPPHNLDAEQGLLGAMLLDRRVRESALLELDVADFYAPAHGHTFDAVASLVAEDVTPDPVLVADRLRRSGRDEPGVAMLTDWMAEAPVSSTAASYIGVIRSDAGLRRKLGWALEAAEALYAGRDPGVMPEDLVRVSSDGSAVSWGPVDLAAVLAEGRPEIRPEWLVRQDGQAMLYPGKVHAFNGESESGKTWLALIAVCHAVRCGEDALIVDFEDDEYTAVGRLAAIGLDADDLAHVIYVRPEEALSDASRARLTGALDGRRVAVAVLDGVAEALTQNGWDENSAPDVLRFFEALPRWLARQGAAVAMIDHVVKDKEKQDRYGRGTGAKLAGVDVTYKVETIAPFGRGKSGRSRVLVMKDRLGWVRRFAGSNKVVAELTMVSDMDGHHVTPELRAPVVAVDEKFRPTGYMEKVSRLLEGAAEQFTGNQIRKLVPGNDTAITKAVACLIAEGYVKAVPGPRGAVFHEIVRPFRENAPEVSGLDCVDDEGGLDG